MPITLRNRCITGYNTRSRPSTSSPSKLNDGSSSSNVVKREPEQRLVLVKQQQQRRARVKLESEEEEEGEGEQPPPAKVQRGAIAIKRELNEKNNPPKMMRSCIQILSPTNSKSHTSSSPELGFQVRSLRRKLSPARKPSASTAVTNLAEKRQAAQRSPIKSRSQHQHVKANDEQQQLSSPESKNVTASCRKRTNTSILLTRRSRSTMPKRRQISSSLASSSKPAHLPRSSSTGTGLHKGGDALGNGTKTPANYSPRKTRSFRHQEDEGYFEGMSKCLQCNKIEPMDTLKPCPSCSSSFHLTCLRLHPRALDFLAAHPDLWECPRCVCCANSDCGEFIASPDHLQCMGCARAWHRACLPKGQAGDGQMPDYPYGQWLCRECKNSPRTPSPSAHPPDGNNNLSQLRHESKRRMQLQRSANIRSPPSNPSSSAMNSPKPKTPTASAAARPSSKAPNSPKTIKARRVAKHGVGKSAKARLPEGERAQVDLYSEQVRVLSEMGYSPEEDRMAHRNSRNQWLQFGQFLRFRPLYESAYKEPLHSAEVIFVCEFCLSPMDGLDTFRSHVMFCPRQFPPGNEIYRNTRERWSIWEVEGSLETNYCRNLCLVAKLFLSSKTLHHEVDTFTFYILTEHTPRGCAIVGYFSKEKNPSKNNNLSCLLTLPSAQGKGYGKLLIDLSYQFSRREHKIGSPEHPLSDLGLVAYRSYWRAVLFSALRQRRDSGGKQQTISIRDLSTETGIHGYDIVSTLLANEMLQARQDSYYIDINKALNCSLASLRRRFIRAEQLHWGPQFQPNPGNKMNSYVSAD